MRRSSRGIATSAIIALGAAVLALIGAPSAAVAANPTTVVFAPADPVTVQFGDEWVIKVAVDTTNEWTPTAPVQPSGGTIDIYLKGFAGPYAAGLPIQPDGIAYFAQPVDQPLLAAGDHELTAIFVPSGGSGLATSQTAAPLLLTVTSVPVTTAVAVEQDAAVSRYPIITARLGGDYVDRLGGAPSGTWSFAVTDSKGEVVFDEDFAQKQSSVEPLRVEITSRLDAGETFTVASQFIPVDELAAGLEVTKTPTKTFTTPGSTFADVVSTRLAFPWWMVLVVGGLLLALVGTVIILGVKLSKTAPKPKPTGADATGIPGDPQNVELMSWDEAGIAEARGDSLPESTTWLLSDIEPAIDHDQEPGTTPPADAPTERLSTTASAAAPADELSNDGEPIVGDEPGADITDKPVDDTTAASDASPRA